jgi:hypothetical protein
MPDTPSLISCRYCPSVLAACDTPKEASGCPLNRADDGRLQHRLWKTRCPELLADRNSLLWALQRLSVWVSPAVMSEDEDTALTEARRICREALGERGASS